jgi:hypothetical protein
MVTIHLHLMPKIRMRGAVPPFLNASSWRGVWLSTGTTLPFLIIPLIFLSSLYGLPFCLNGGFRTVFDVLHHESK